MKKFMNASAISKELASRKGETDSMLMGLNIAAGSDEIDDNLADSLAYGHMRIRKDGTVMTDTEIRDLRQRQGYCLTCPGDPVKLFDVKRSKMNPLYQKKEPIESSNQSIGGLCLKCNPVSQSSSLRRSSKTSSSLALDMLPGTVHSLRTESNSNQPQKMNSFGSTGQNGSNGTITSNAASLVGLEISGNLTSAPDHASLHNGQKTLRRLGSGTTSTGFAQESASSSTRSNISQAVRRKSLESPKIGAERSLTPTRLDYRTGRSLRRSNSDESLVSSSNQTAGGNKLFRLRPPASYLRRSISNDDFEIPKIVGQSVKHIMSGSGGYDIESLDNKNNNDNNNNSNSNISNNNSNISNNNEASTISKSPTTANFSTTMSTNKDTLESPGKEEEEEDKFKFQLPLEDKLHDSSHFDAFAAVTKGKVPSWDDIAKFVKKIKKQSESNDGNPSGKADSKMRERMNSVDSDGFLEQTSDSSHIEFNSSFADFVNTTSVGAFAKAEGSLLLNEHRDKDNESGNKDDDDDEILFFQHSTDSKKAVPERRNSDISCKSAEEKSSTVVIRTKAELSMEPTAGHGSRIHDPSRLEQMLLEFIEASQHQFAALDKKVTMIMDQQTRMLEQNSAILKLFIDSKSTIEANVMQARHSDGVQDLRYSSTVDDAVQESAPRKSREKAKSKSMLVEEIQLLSPEVLEPSSNRYSEVQDEKKNDVRQQSIQTALLTEAGFEDYVINMVADPSQSFRKGTALSPQRRRSSSRESLGRNQSLPRMKSCRNIAAGSAGVSSSSSSSEMDGGQVMEPGPNGTGTVVVAEGTKRKSSRRMESFQDRPKSPRRRSKSGESHPDALVEDDAHPADPAAVDAAETPVSGSRSKAQQTAQEAELEHLMMHNDMTMSYDDGTEITIKTSSVQRRRSSGRYETADDLGMQRRSSSRHNSNDLNKKKERKRTKKRTSSSSRRLEDHATTDDDDDGVAITGGDEAIP